VLEALLARPVVELAAPEQMALAVAVVVALQPLGRLALAVWAVPVPNTQLPQAALLAQAAAVVVVARRVVLALASMLAALVVFMAALAAAAAQQQALTLTAVRALRAQSSSHTPLTPTPLPSS